MARYNQTKISKYVSGDKKRLTKQKYNTTIYLKIPEGMDAEWEKDFTDHYPCNGLIEYSFGENLDLRSEAIKFKPEVGKFLVFPSYLKHFVYPFKCKGERRSMSFNADMRLQ